MVRRLNTERKKKVLPKLIERQLELCYLCGKELGPPKFHKGDKIPKWSSPTIEHLIELCLGGRNTMDNMVAAHNKCNNDKETKRTRSKSAVTAE